ncbi:helix-turn-helix domain-containing protein [Streptomyces sp. NPDC088794]|uniref:helix-turn-helix domain-containing protein n=1 Tax=Streptomyces sp. NPDC088794 TaxID=3365902 RepID=UPI00381974AD
MDVVSTAEVSTEERFAFWREVHTKLWVPFDIRCDSRTESEFQAQVGASEIGPVQAALITTMPHSVHRTPKLIRQDDPGTLKLGCVVRGGGMVTKGSHRIDQRVGDLVLHDTSRPYQAEFAPQIPVHQLLLLSFPRGLLPLPERDLQRLSTRRIPGTRGIGALSSQFLLHFARHMHEFSPSDTARLSTLILDVLSTALAEALDAERVIPPHSRQRALLAQIHAFIRDNLGDTDLTPDAIATAHHISVRYLHKLFQQDGHTVAGWIRKRRLEQCRRDLADPRLAALPIHAIAARWGFTRPAHFSQAFRHAYGVTPRQCREQSATVHAD